MKVYILLALVGAVYCDQVVTDEVMELTIFPYENFGNGVRNPENLEQIRHDCSVQGFRFNSVSKSHKDFVVATSYILRVTSTTRTVVMPKSSFMFWDFLGYNCNITESQQLTYAQVTNSKLRESKEIRDRFMGYLNEVLNSDKVDWAQLVCVGRKFFDDVINVHDDYQGFRDYARKRASFFTEQYNNLAKYNQVENEIPQTCELKEQYPQSRFKTYTMLLIKILQKHRSIFADKVLTMDLDTALKFPFMLPPEFYTTPKVPLPSGSDSSMSSIPDHKDGGRGGSSSPLPSMPSGASLYSGLSSSRDRYDLFNRGSRYESTSNRNYHDLSANKDQQETRLASKQYQDWLANQDLYNKNKRDALSKSQYESWSNKPTYDAKSGITNIEKFTKEARYGSMESGNDRAGSNTFNYGGQKSGYPSGSPHRSSNYVEPSGGYNPSAQPSTSNYGRHN